MQHTNLQCCSRHSPVLAHDFAASRVITSASNLQLDCLLQAAMWNQTVWPLVPRKQQEKDQPSKQDEALITQLWDQLVRCQDLCTSICCGILAIALLAHQMFHT